MSHCTYERPNSRYHKVYIDYQEIAGFDVSNGIGIRFFAQKTDERIGWCRTRYGIPEGQLPPDAWLWLDESVAAPAAMAYYACGVRGRTTLARTIRDCNPKHLPPSLIQLGYVKTRYIARRSRYATPARVFTALHHDHEGKAFIIVEDYQGYYLDMEGELHCSIEEGYSEVVKQYLFCFDVVNAAIAAIDGSVPPALPRYDPQQKMVPQQEAHRNNNVSRTSDTNKGDTSTRTISGGNLNSALAVVSMGEDTIDAVASSTVTQKVRDSSDLQTAPWTVETILALQRAVLPVPDRATCDPATWDKEWQRPTELAMVALSTLSPALAWERIDLTTRYMVDDTSPSYWRTGRAKQTPTTMRHVASHIVDYYQAYQKSPWHPSTTTPYDGPPLEFEDYQEGYKGEEPASEPPIIVEEPEILPRPAWMTREEATELCYAIEDAHPMLKATLTPLDGVTDRWYTSVQWGPGKDDWLDFPDPDAWQLPSPETIDRIDQAQRFAAEHNAIPTEVGVVEEVPEPPPIVMEVTPDGVAPADGEETYISMEEVGVDLQRGLRPLSTPPVEVAPVVAKAPPLQVPQGMSLILATSLLDYLISAKQLNAELYPLADDRAGLRIETASGWITIDDAEAWRQYLASSPSPPVIAMNGMGQPLEVAQ